MADIVESLFGLTPIRQQVDLYNRAQDLDLGTLIGQATVNQYAPLDRQKAYIAQQGAQAALGGMAVRGLGSLFGLQDPMLKRATGLEAILQSTQQDLGEEANNPTVFYPELQKRLADNGFTREALQVGQVAQKAIQDYGLTQAKLMTERAQLAKATQEKLPEVVRLKQAYDQAVAAGDMSTANVIAAQIEKNVNIPEKILTPRNQAEQAKLKSFIKQFGEEEGSTKFIEWINQLDQKISAAQGTGAILNEAGKTIGAYDDKGTFTAKNGEVIPKEQMLDFRNSQEAASNLLSIMTNITSTDINNAFGKPNVTGGGVGGAALRFAANPEVTSAQTKINSLGVKEVLTNLQQLKGASSDKEMARVASTFPGFEAPPQVMEEWLARAVLTTTKFLNKNKARYGFDAPVVNLQELAQYPVLKAIPATERARFIEDLAKYDENFKALPEDEKIKVLNSIVSGGKLERQGAAPKVQTRTTKSGVKYTVED